MLSGLRCRHLQVDIVATSRTGRVLLQPRHDALSVKVMLAPEKEDFIIAAVLFDADGAYVVFLYFVDSSCVESGNCIVFDSTLLL